MARDRCVYGSYMGRAVGVNISSDASAPNDAFQYVLRVYNRFYRNILARVDINTRTGGPTLGGRLSSSLRFFFFFFFLGETRLVYLNLFERLTIGDRLTVYRSSFSRSPNSFVKKSINFSFLL